MGRKNVIDGFSSISAGDMSGDITGTVSDVLFTDNIGMQATWSGTAPVGELLVQGSNDGITYTDLDFGVPIAVTGTPGNLLININQFPYSKIRVYYDRTSGSGTLNVKLTSKQIGG